MTLTVVSLFIRQTRGVCVPLQRIHSRNNMFSYAKAAICTQLPFFGSVTPRHVVSQNLSRFKVMIIIMIIFILHFLRNSKHFKFKPLFIHSTFTLVAALSYRTWDRLTRSAAIGKWTIGLKFHLVACLD